MNFEPQLSWQTGAIIIGLIFGIIVILRRGKKNRREPYTEDGLGHNHEWEELYHTDENGNWVRKKGWIFCWICGQEKLYDNEKTDS